MLRLEFCGVKKRVDEMINGSVFQWFSHIERIENLNMGQAKRISHFGNEWRRFMKGEYSGLNLEGIEPLNSTTL